MLLWSWILLATVVAIVVGAAAVASSSTADGTKMKALNIASDVLKALPGLYKAVLNPITFASGSVTEEASTTLRDAAIKAVEGQQKASVAFIQLSELAAEYGDSKVGFWGTVKEVGVDDTGLTSFHEKFYSFPLYRDVENKTYKAFGSKSIKMSLLNPINMYRAITRTKTKKIKGNLKGEGFVQGGIMVFDKQGELKFAVQETFAVPYPMDEFKAKLDEIINAE